MLNPETVIDELGRFTDLDSRFQIDEDQNDLVINFAQLGSFVNLRAAKSGGRVIERRDGDERRHNSYSGLLASTGFGNLRRMAEAQRALLSRDAPYLFRAEMQLPVFGRLDMPNTGATSDFITKLDDWLASTRKGQGQRSLVLDGPAGIGKTHVIRSICYRRVHNFGPGQRPLLLHVQSRGRKLTTLSDVIAGTLNVLRISLTNEQLPVLVRHGLIDVAIDGFDELADPNGYETAWASLRDFAEDVSGHGCIVLAGRDTFIDADQIRKSLSRLDTPELGVAHLLPLPPKQATDWLEHRGLPEAALDTLKDVGFLDADSYTLRPFYVLQVAKTIDSHALEQLLENPIKILIEALVAREADILIGPIASISKPSLVLLLMRFFQEVAREMADGERDWIDLSTLSLLAELIFADQIRDEEVGALRHRVHTIALLEQDVDSSKRRFPHSEIQDYFLAFSYLNLICRVRFQSQLDEI